MLSFSPVVGIGTPPTPQPQASVPPPSLVPGKGAYTLAGERGGGRVPIPTRGHTLWYSLYIRTYFVVKSLPLDGDVKESVWKGRVCFLCMRTKFGIFSRGQKCDMCKQIVCARCFTKVWFGQRYGFPDWIQMGGRKWFTNRFKEGKMERLLLLVFWRAGWFMEGCTF